MISAHSSVRGGGAAGSSITGGASLDAEGEVHAVVVIGGGLSGLCAASYLAKCNVDVVVLEARERLGGRTCTEEVIDGFQTDLGGAYVGPTQDRILRVADELGVETYPIHRDGKNIMQCAGIRREHEGEIPPLDPIGLLDVNNLLVTTERLAQNIPKDPEAQRALDNMSVQEWVNKHAWTRAGDSLYRAAVKCVMASDPAEASFLYWLQCIQSAGSTQLLFEEAQERKFVGGSQQISDKLGEALGDRVRLNSPVRSIDWGGLPSSPGATPYGATVTTRSGAVFSCQYVIIAMAPALYGRLEFSPPLPALRNQLTQRMPMGSIIKTVTWYERPWWREDGYSGSLLCDDGPVIYTYDDCKPDGSKAALMGFVLADKARAWVNQSPERRSEAIAQQYARVFGNDAALSPVLYAEKNWMEEEFSGGCYVGVMPPRVLTEFGRALREPMGCCHFAGTETATTWMGYMDGAVQAGERAAHEVAASLALREVAMTSGPDQRVLKVPPTAPVVEPPNETVPHPKSVGPCLIEKLLPSVGQLFSIIALSVAAVGAGVLHRRWNSSAGGK